MYYSPIPLCVAFEPINLCNAQCFCCPYTEFAMDKAFTKTKMSKEQITYLIEDWANLLRQHKINHGERQYYHGVIPIHWLILIWKQF